MKMKVTFIIIFILSGLTVNGQVEKELNKKGFVFGVSSGVSHTLINFPTEELSIAGIGINWKVGYMLNTNLAVLLNGAISIYEYDLTDRPRKRDFGGIFPSAQYWISDRFWILGGVGLATDAPVFFDLKPENPDELKYYTGVGVISSVGFEFYRTSKLMFDIQARVIYDSIHFPEARVNGLSSSLLLGINF
ncbi:hypothetical protein [Marivirga aurantiaca]|nr:hypothetical protein [Marivirga aurantiaca]